MLEEITAQLLEAKERRDRGLSLRDQLPLMREELAREVYQLHALEASMDACQAKVDKLQSISVSAIMASLTGRKESQLTACLEEIEHYQKEFDACVTEVAKLETQLNQSESDLANMDQLNQVFEQLLEQKKTLICQSHSEQADQLKNLTSQITLSKRNRQDFNKAIQIGEDAIERMFSLIRSKGRARNRGINSRAGGVLIAAAVNQVMQGNPAKPAIRRVSEGLEKFHQSILQLGYHSDHPRDKHIMELAAVVASSSTNLSKSGASQIVWDASQENPIMDAVQEIVGLLKEDLKDILKQIKTVETEIQTLIENA